MIPLNVLIACEESQTECEAFLRAGCNAYSCDLQKCSGPFPSRHIVGDVRSLFVPGSFVTTQDGLPLCVPRWDLIIAHPPCTYLCRVSSVHLFKNGKVDDVRYAKGLEAARFFREMLNAPATYVCVENPVPCRIFKLPAPSCAVNPFDFGEPWPKKTLYWLKNLPPLMTGVSNPNFRSWVHCTRGGKKRSKSFPAIAAAMVQQWLPFILSDKNLNPTDYEIL